VWLLSVLPVLAVALAACSSGSGADSSNITTAELQSRLASLCDAGTAKTYQPNVTANEGGPSVALGAFDCTRLGVNKIHVYVFPQRISTSEIRDIVANEGWCNPVDMPSDVECQVEAGTEWGAQIISTDPTATGNLVLAALHSLNQ
jgi:hypothetical protein